MLVPYTTLARWAGLRIEPSGAHTYKNHVRNWPAVRPSCIIGANESSEASAAPEGSTPSSPPSMVKWAVGDSVDYEVNGTWYPGYIARSDSSTLYFKYEATKFKSYEEPIKKADRDDLARLRAGSGSGPPAAAKKKKPAARKPAAKAKSPAKKKTVAKPAARKPAAKPSAKKPAAKKSCEPASRRWRPPPRRRRGATRHPGAGPRRKNQRSRRSRPPARKRSSSLRTVYLRAKAT